MKNIQKFVIAILFIILLTGCSAQTELESYEGRDLSIAVVGEAPDVEEQQVEFDEISFDEFEETTLWKYDAVFIMEEHLAEAAESEYTSVYMGVHIPFFFFGSNEGEGPLPDLGLAFGETEKDYYATSFLQRSNNEQSIARYAVGDEGETEENIKALYAQMFRSIELSDGDK
ncbi:MULTISPECIES: hypothetical protein [unclassified Planococcus (in: firmicutes)]|uniref:hypothetical protein n=1 Tax=unclassified Planococcus (in: firmicutes) TaxID=2662419 RepID=UPI000C342FCE|nr:MULTISPECIES: hypothetical protein [unclassified Planococcus (in: firmicutes)]AUD14973.1 hypothetical protein CW734_16500 [Planococcus sp. MB-3u-03]PKG47088.1 hypothetical protein CXF66_04620 [Planococcus sp. Urea-trap-24]PKG87783.1 hypothetical protein CXF91_17590 [Planococcus sp. Urea-3u-39]PKH35441.1 hypothetical protein CXF77_17270 [Planococcus sp. MB-3u-09]